MNNENEYNFIKILVQWEIIRDIRRGRIFKAKMKEPKKENWMVIQIYSLDPVL